MKKYLLFALIGISPLLFSQQCFKYADSDQELSLMLSDDYKTVLHELDNLVYFGNVEFNSKKNRYFLPRVIDVRIKMAFELLPNGGIQLLLNGLRGAELEKIECSENDSKMFELVSNYKK